MEWTRISLNHLLLVLALSQTTWENSTTSLAKELLGSLLDTYSLYQIPRNGSDPLLVTVTVSVINVLNLDILKYTISSVLLLNQSWYNKQLTWDETDFPFSSITVPWDSVWTPSHTVQEAFEVEWITASPDVVLHSDGKVELQLSLRIDSNCNFDLFYYPRDEAHCSLSFFFMDNTVNELEFKVSIKNEILNVKREYLVTGMNATSQRDTLQPFFVVMINLENTGIRTILSLIVPSIALMIADLCGFLLPLKDRPSYMVTLLLAHLVFHSTLVGSLPGASSCNPLLNCPLNSGLAPAFGQWEALMLVDRFHIPLPSAFFCDPWKAYSQGCRTCKDEHACYYYIGLLMLLFLSTIETILLTKWVTDNNDHQLKHEFQEATTTTVLAKHESDHREDKNSRMNDYGTEKEESNFRPAPAALDRLSFFIFLGLVVILHLLFAGVWLLWKCESKTPPGEGHLEGIRKGW